MAVLTGRLLREIMECNSEWPACRRPTRRIAAANRGSNAGDDIASNTSSLADLTPLAAAEFIRLGAKINSDHDIACKTLPCVFARLGLVREFQCQADSIAGVLSSSVSLFG